MSFPFILSTFNYFQNNTQFKYKINDNNGKEVIIVKLILPEGSPSLEERAILSDKKPKDQSLILMWGGGFDDSIIRGCPEWNCKTTDNRSMLATASAVIFNYVDTNVERRPGQYFVFYSQESPIHMSINSKSDFFNMSFGFRMDTPGASPYGFAALLAPESKPNKNKLNKQINELIAKKRKDVAWFVSHCSTHSKREWIAKEMQKYINVDIYGSCGTLQCSKGVGLKCVQMLDTDYWFYFAAENSICKDYLTEKIWDQGLSTFSVPIVLKRSLVQHLLPPFSFIAVDDYKSIQEFTHHLKTLINTPQEYMKYLLWRYDYVSIKLNGDTDPRAEKLFGVCQICKLTQMHPRPIITLPAPVNEWWDNSCDRSDLLIEKFKKNDEEN